MTQLEPHEVCEANGDCQKVAIVYVYGFQHKDPRKPNGARLCELHAKRKLQRLSPARRAAMQVINLGQGELFPHL